MDAFLAYLHKSRAAVVEAELRLEIPDSPHLWSAEDVSYTREALKVQLV